MEDPKEHKPDPKNILSFNNHPLNDDTNAELKRSATEDKK